MKTFTEGHCVEKAKPGGCQLHNLHCGYPNCDRRPIADPSVGLSAEDRALLERVLGRPDQFPQGERELHNLLDAARAEGRSPCPEGVTEEEIARIIEPEAWAWVDRMHKVDALPKSGWAMTARSIEKARAILAALSQRPAAVGGGKEDCSSLPPATRIGPGPTAYDWRTAPATGLEDAIAEFKEKLPGWWFKVCECQVSCDATCAPTRESPDIALVEHNNPFDTGFDADLLQPSTLAEALRDVMHQALTAKAALEDQP